MTEGISSEGQSKPLLNHERLLSESRRRFYKQRRSGESVEVLG